MARLYRVIVPVRDIEFAQEFYESILGNPGRRVSPERHYFNCEGTILACFDPTKFHEKHEVIPNPEHIYLAVDDLDNSYGQCVAAGAKIVEEIKSYPWGETSFYIEDPFQNQICFVARGTIFTGSETEDTV